MQAPLLTICIPTYQRVEYLTVCLKSLLNQDLEMVEILVRDNASKDATEDLLRQYQAKLPIRYEIGTVNDGADHNFGKLVKLARGKYCWLLGDDDAVLPGAVRAIKSMLLESHPLILQLGYVQGTNMLEPTQNIQPSRAFIDVGAGHCVTSLPGFLAAQPNVSLLFAFISSFIFRRSCWMFNDESEKWYGTNYVHLYQMHNALRNACEAKIFTMPRPCVIARGNIANAITSKVGEITWLDARTLSNVCSTIYENDEAIRTSFATVFRKTYPLIGISSVLAQTRSYIDKPTQKALHHLGFSKLELGMAKILGRPLFRTIALTLIGRDHK